MSNQILSLFISIFLYIVLAASYYGWGWVVASVVVKKQFNDFNITLIWLGWAFTLFLFQLIHLLFPLTAYAVAPLLIIGVLLFVNHLPDTWKVRHFWSIKNLKEGTAFLAFFFIVIWVASRSMLSPTAYDSGLYHFNIIRWINTYPIVPGLGNLHGRLAYNQSFFTYAAALNFFPLFGQGRAIANSFLFLLMIGTLFVYLQPILAKPVDFIKAHPFRFLPSVLSMPILIFLAFTSSGLASPTPDLASTLLQVNMIVIFTRGLADWMEKKSDQKYTAMLLIVVGVSAVTVKLSNLVFVAVISLIVIAYFWHHPQKPSVELVRIVSLAFLMMMIWFLSGILLSGMPLYPSTIGYIPMEWAVSRESAIDMTNWISSWAKEPGKNPADVLGTWNWFYPWLVRLSMNLVEVVYPLILSIMFFTLSIVLSFIKRVKLFRMLEVFVAMPIISALVFWFLTAPDPRFAHALFFLLMLSSIILFLVIIKGVTNQRVYGMVLCLAILLGYFSVGYYAVRHRQTLAEISFSGYQAIQQVPLVEKITRAGLLVYAPESGDQCWDAPLPCTPNYDPSLALRETGDLASGFTIAKQD